MNYFQKHIYTKSNINNIEIQVNKQEKNTESYRQTQKGKRKPTFSANELEIKCGRNINLKKNTDW